MAAPFAVSARFDARQVQAALYALAPRQWAFAEALALTRIGQQVHTAERKEVGRVFDRPTPFTLNSLRLQRATRQRLEARVWFKDPPRLTELEHYLLPQVTGGLRRQKRFEQTLQRKGLLGKGKALVPTSAAPLDAYGNVNRGLYARILADLKASPIGANTTGAGRRRRRRQGDGGFFYGNPRGKGRGIWQRGVAGNAGFGARLSGGITPIFLETRMPAYRRRFAFFEIAERTVEHAYGPAFDQAATETLRTAR